MAGDLQGVRDGGGRVPRRRGENSAESRMRFFHWQSSEVNYPEFPAVL